MFSPSCLKHHCMIYIYIKIFTTTTIRRIKVSESLLASRTYLWMYYVKRRFTSTEMFTVNESFPNPIHSHCGSWTNNYRVILWYFCSWDRHYVPLNNVKFSCGFLIESKIINRFLGISMTMSIQWKLFTHTYIGSVL